MNEDMKAVDAARRIEELETRLREYERGERRQAQVEAAEVSNQLLAEIMRRLSAIEARLARRPIWPHEPEPGASNYAQMQAYQHQQAMQNAHHEPYQHLHQVGRIPNCAPGRAEALAAMTTGAALEAPAAEAYRKANGSLWRAAMDRLRRTGV